mmetsp:Transcript_89139/g.160787  ORF Transcript_89139/g.160787 Transcript_89139/m.160787 type:complete len:226 (-) Transcript_89139:3963-4640(-)
MFRSDLRSSQNHVGSAIQQSNRGRKRRVRPVKVLCTTVDYPCEVSILQRRCQHERRQVRGCVKERPTGKCPHLCLRGRGRQRELGGRDGDLRPCLPAAQIATCRERCGACGGSGDQASPVFIGYWRAGCREGAEDRDDLVHQVKSLCHDHRFGRFVTVQSNFGLDTWRNRIVRCPHLQSAPDLQRVSVEGRVDCARELQAPFDGEPIQRRGDNIEQHVVVASQHY